MTFKEKFKQLRATLLGIDPGIMNLYYRVIYKPASGSMAQVLDHKLKSLQPFCFVQIGGNDGFINDPVFRFVKRYPCKGIIVEPQKDVFNDRLKKTYRSEKKVILENIAISDKSGIRKLYKLSISNSRWATGLASFKRSSLLDQIEEGYVSRKAKKEGISLPDSIDDWITFEEVNCTTIQDLLIKHQFKTLDFLQIDTEGYDFEIIKTIDFSQLKPLIISYENLHLGEQDKISCEELLVEHGYRLEHIGSDSIAFNKIGL